MTVMSLTDHDAVAGVPDAVAAAEEAGIECVPAVEMSCVHKYSDDLHMLGYWVDLDEIAPACDRAQQERVNRAREIIERLNAHGVEVTFEDAVAQAGGTGLIVGPGCVLTMNTPDDNVAAVIRALGGPLKPVPGIKR